MELSYTEVSRQSLLRSSLSPEDTVSEEALAGLSLHIWSDLTSLGSPFPQHTVNCTLLAAGQDWTDMAATSLYFHVLF